MSGRDWCEQSWKGLSPGERRNYGILTIMTDLRESRRCFEIAIVDCESFESERERFPFTREQKMII